MPLIKRKERFFGRFLHPGSPKFKLSEIRLKKMLRKCYQKCVGLIIKNTLFARFETV